MSKKAVSPEHDVIIFLKELKDVLTNPKFNVSTDLDILLKKSKELPTDPFTTFNTMQALQYDRHDLVSQFMALDVSNYMETFIDDKDNTLPPFFAFCKTIENREVYIKLKIRDRESCKVFCVSFHFARFPLPAQRPYA